MPSNLSTRNENVYSGILNDLQGTQCCIFSLLPFYMSVERCNYRLPMLICCKYLLINCSTSMLVALLQHTNGG